jgi:hypothetical protein
VPSRAYGFEPGLFSLQSLAQFSFFANPAVNVYYGTSWCGALTNQVEFEAASLAAIVFQLAIAALVAEATARTFNRCLGRVDQRRLDPRAYAERPR